MKIKYLFWIFVFVLLIGLCSANSVKEINELNLTLVFTQDEYSSYLQNSNPTLIIYNKTNNISVFQNQIILSNIEIEDLISRIHSSTIENDVLSFIESKYNIDLINYKNKSTFEFYQKERETGLFILLSSKFIYFFIFITILFILSIYTFAYFFNLKNTKSSNYLQVKEYIQTNLKEGYEIPQIKLALVHAGYNQKLVEKIIKELNR